MKKNSFWCGKIPRPCMPKSIHTKVPWNVVPATRFYVYRYHDHVPTAWSIVSPQNQLVNKVFKDLPVRNFSLFIFFDIFKQIAGVFVISAIILHELIYDKDLENLSGIKAHMIRIWEQRYSFLNPNVPVPISVITANEELKKILNVACWINTGTRFRILTGMAEGEMQERVLSLNQAGSPARNALSTILSSIAWWMWIWQGWSRCSINICFQGIERTITQIIFLFRKIGILWLTNHINRRRSTWWVIWSGRNRS